jgi:competence protein ComGC
MKKKKLIIIAGALAAVTVIGTVTAFAATSAASDTAKGPGFSDTVKTAVDSLVTAGTITADQETAVLTALQPPAPTDGTAPADTGKHDRMTAPLDALVTAGTITSDQETAIADALKAAGPHDSDSCKTALDALVTAGTITADQETAVLTALQPKADGTAKTNPMTAALDALVTAGTITADQETAILTAVHSAMPTAPADQGPGRGGPGHGRGDCAPPSTGATASAAA